MGCQREANQTYKVSTCSQLGKGTAPDAKTAKNCQSSGQQTDQALTRYEQAIQALPSRDQLFSSQQKVLNEIAELKKASFAIGKDALDTGAGDPWQTFEKITELDKRLIAIETRSREIRSNWTKLMRFPPSSPVWKLASLLKDPELPVDAKAAIESFQESFPSACWGESKGTPSELSELAGVIEMATRIIKFKYQAMERQIPKALQSEAGKQLAEIHKSRRAIEYIQKVYARLKDLRFEEDFKSFTAYTELQLRSGVVITPLDRSQELLDALRLAQAKMPKEDPTATDVHFAKHIADAEKLHARLSKLRAERDTKLSEFSKDLRKALRESAASTEKTMKDCRFKSPVLASWWLELRENERKIQSAMEESAKSPQHLRARHIMAEQAWEDLHLLQSLCNELGDRGASR